MHGASLTLVGYDRSRTRRRHLVVIRDYPGAQPYRSAARHALAEAAGTKYELEDLINVAIEQLVRQHFELPALDSINRATRRVRATLTRALYQHVFNALSEDDLVRIDTLFITDLTTHHDRLPGPRRVDASGEVALSGRVPHTGSIVMLV
jgi:hypothetical protein